MKNILITSLMLIIFFACQQDPDSPPDNPQDEPIECPDGYHICDSDSTECCLDTTSHNFMWEVDTLGGYSSFLNDVVIINENNIWAVGYIKVPDPDSSFNGTGFELFNAAHWNGNEWELIRIINSATLYSIFYFSENDIWVTKYGYPVHWDGNSWTQYNLTDMGIEGSPGQGIWGTSSDNIYFVGDNGSIVHYNGIDFTEMNSGTDVDLKNIVGNENSVFIIGYDYTNNPNISLELKNGEWTPFYESAGYYGDPNNPEDYGKPYGIDVLGDTVYLATSGSLGPSNLVKYDYITGEMTADSLNHLYSLIFIVREIIVNDVNDIFILDKYVNIQQRRLLIWKEIYVVGEQEE